LLIEAVGESPTAFLNAPFRNNRLEKSLMKKYLQMVIDIKLAIMV